MKRNFFVCKRQQALKGCTYSSRKSYSRRLCNFFDPLQDVLLLSMGLLGELYESHWLYHKQWFELGTVVKQNITFLPKIYLNTIIIKKNMLLHHIDYGMNLCLSVGYKLTLLHFLWQYLVNKIFTLKVFLVYNFMLSLHHSHAQKKYFWAWRALDVIPATI